MAKFGKRKRSSQQKINTSSLPDIVFMLLFFFMVSTTMKEVTMMVKIQSPDASEVTKLEQKSLVSYIYVGKPLNAKKYGSEPRIQLNDSYATVDDIENYIIQERDNMKESDRPKMTVSIKADLDVQMGTITDIKQALRKAQALKISYSARKAVK
ncbi:MAG: biopolymer transporter ExbD [Bacteroidales bacterium]|jgi:biopolymer transport protein ExbD|nr:biopolymer transporter ExbD [Bacteroidales bacterium]MCR5696305.1 biopolymer transporter ExbD [Marinilabiliaceae bacterium]